LAGLLGLAGAGVAAEAAGEAVLPSTDGTGAAGVTATGVTLGGKVNGPLEPQAVSSKAAARVAVRTVSAGIWRRGLPRGALRGEGIAVKAMAVRKKLTG